MSHQLMIACMTSPLLVVLLRLDDPRVVGSLTAVALLACCVFELATQRERRRQVEALHRQWDEALAWRRAQMDRRIYDIYD